MSLDNLVKRKIFIETAKNAVRARLESQLSKNRNKVKELTAAIDNLQVKNVEESISPCSWTGLFN